MSIMGRKNEHQTEIGRKGFRNRCRLNRIKAIKRVACGPC